MYRFRYRMTTTYTEYNTLLYTVATVTLLYNNNTKLQISQNYIGVQPQRGAFV